MEQEEQEERASCKEPECYQLTARGSDLPFCVEHSRCITCYYTSRVNEYTKYCAKCFIAYEVPPKQQQEPYYGYKIYSYNVGTNLLVGGYGTEWKQAHLHYKCDYPGLGKAYKSLFKCFENQHSCGIYVYKDRPPQEYGGILAKVVCWGEIIEHSEGARASDVKIIELYLNYPHINDCHKFIHYGVPITCAPGTHYLEGNIYLYGGAVRAMFEKNAVVKDYDVLLGWDTFLEKGLSFYRGGTSRNKEDRWGEWWHKHYMTGQLYLGVANNRDKAGISLDATILGGQPTLSLDEAKELLANTIDYRCNSVIYYKGEFHESIPGGLDDLKNKRFIQVNNQVADWRKEHIIKWATKWGWTVNGSLYIKEEQPIIVPDKPKAALGSTSVMGLNPALGFMVSIDPEPTDSP